MGLVRMTHAPQLQVDTCRGRASFRIGGAGPILVLLALVMVSCGRGPLPVLLPDEVLLVSVDELATEIATPPADAPALPAPPAGRAHPVAQDAIDSWAASAEPFVSGRVLYSGACIDEAAAVFTPLTLCVSDGPIPDAYYLGPSDQMPWYVVGVRADASGTTVTEIVRGRG